ncbi:MAG: DUF2007 domain-containing protein [Rhodospirillum sp.]|nr:DUF2007 domain-containing protein [Rhodospirillum sp.]MCF8491748.1 DUF2007 domain-containing protein [Rhodospirillum sp.]MCF8502988.1 DUF2007 domain-containing protein [Rhodospirillum sp.]
MEELTLAGDPVFLSWLASRLEEEGIPYLIFDSHTDAAFAGALTALATRVMVDADDLPRAKAVLAEGEGITS